LSKEGLRRAFHRGLIVQAWINSGRGPRSLARKGVPTGSVWLGEEDGSSAVTHVSRPHIRKYTLDLTGSLVHYVRASLFRLIRLHAPPIRVIEVLVRQMKSVVLPLLAAAVCVCLSNAVRANTFYVATSGNDSHPGTSAQPWLTLQHGVDTISPGDTILVESGTYVGCRIGNSGQAGAVCTLEADSGASVLINAAGPVNKHNSNIEVELFGGTVSYWVIAGFESADSLNYGIDLRGTQFITIQNCFTTQSTLTGIFLAFCDNSLIQNNETSFNNEHGIYDSNSSANSTIRANRSHDNHGSGIHMNGDNSEQPGDGLITFALVEKNIIYNNGAGGGSGINCDGVTNSTIRNNLIYNNLASGISLYAIDGAQGSSNDLIYNNTIVMAPGSRWPINIAASTGGQPNPTGNQIKNNILYTPDAGHGSVTTYGPAVSGFASDYNVVVPTFSVDGDNTTISLSAWHALGYDLHSIVAVPANLFVDPANNNYQLKAGSPAIGAGISLPQVTDDINGTPRPANPSIGCYEVAPLAQRTFASASGNDSNPCSIGSPCRTIGAALGAVAPGGEVVIMNSAGYGPFTISKAVTIIASQGVYAGVSVPSGDGITITAGPADVVILRGLTVNGVGGANGITFNSGQALFVERCVINGFSANGINFSGGGRLSAKDSIIRNNTGAGIRLAGAVSELALASIDRVRLEANGTGLAVFDGAKASLRNSVASGNTTALSVTVSTAPGEINIEKSLIANNATGASAQGSAGATGTIRISKCTVTDNGVGLFQQTGGVLLSGGRNKFGGNTTNSTGTIGSYTLQ
jgi:parallel beta-helix repeat protein